MALTGSLSYVALSKMYASTVLKTVVSVVIVQYTVSEAGDWQHMIIAYHIYYVLVIEGNTSIIYNDMS